MKRAASHAFDGGSRTLRVRGVCGHVWTLDTERWELILSNVDAAGLGKERAYCAQCYRETGAAKNRTRITVERKEVCSCGTVLNQHNQSGECGACRIKRSEERAGEVLGAEGAGFSSEAPEAKQEANP